MKIMEVTRAEEATQVPVEEAIRVESGGKMRRTTMARGCLYCALQLPDTAEFCPQCGRPIETGFAIRPIQESELDSFGPSYGSWRASAGSGTSKDGIRVENGGKMRRTTIARGCLYCALQLPDTAEFCPQCGRSIETGFAIRPIQESEFVCSHKEMKGKDGLLRQRGVSSDGSGPLTWKNLHTLESAQSAEHIWSRVNGHYSSGQND